MRNIVVLGCGFAGYHAARKLEKSLVGRRRVQLTIVTSRTHFIFAPLLPGIASGELEPEHLTTPVEDAFGPRTQVIIDEIEGIDFEARSLIGSKDEIPFDYLLVASGGVRDTEAFEGADALAGPDLLSDAIAIRDELEEQRRSGDLPLRFGIIGASTTGVEWAAELATSLAIDSGLSATTEEVAIDLFEAGPRILPDHSPKFSAAATKYLQQLGIELHLNTRVHQASKSQIRIAQEEPRTYSQVFHCGGRIGALSWVGSETEVDERGRLVVDQHLAVPGHCGVYAAGDAAAPFADLPPSSNPQLALQQGRWAARNLLAGMTGRTQKPFLFEARGDFVTLGRNQAALELRGLVLEGTAAWLAYRLYYTALMPRPIEKKHILRDWISRRIAAAPSDPARPSLPPAERSPQDHSDEDKNK